MRTPPSPNDCFSAELFFFEYFVLSLINVALLLDDVSRFLPHFFFCCGMDVPRI